MAEHISRKELKQDKIHDAFEHGAEAVYSHKQVALIIVLVVAVFAAGYAVWSVYVDRQTAATELFALVRRRARAGLIAPDVAAAALIDFDTFMASRARRLLPSNRQGLLPGLRRRADDPARRTGRRRQAGVRHF